MGGSKVGEGKADFLLFSVAYIFIFLRTTTFIIKKKRGGLNFLRRKKGIHSSDVILGIRFGAWAR